MLTLSPDLLRKVKQIQLRASRLATDVLAGEYHSAFKGRGMEFDEVREYVPGDDIRAIDWNVTARMQHPFVKVWREERELTIHLLVDVSPSQNFGTEGRTKGEAAAELAALWAFLAIRNHDRVGLTAFSDHVERLVPLGKGKGHVWNIVRTILSHETIGKGTNLSDVLATFHRVQRRRCIMVLITDFLADGYLSHLSLLAKRHEVICMGLGDHREIHLPDAGLVRLRDLETGLMMTADFRSSRKLELTRQNLLRQKRDMVQALAQVGASLVNVSPSDDTADVLTKFLHGRQRRLLQ